MIINEFFLPLQSQICAISCARSLNVVFVDWMTFATLAPDREVGHVSCLY